MNGLLVAWAVMGVFAVMGLAETIRDRSRR